MSPDLARALHDAVDTGPSDPPFALDGLAARIKRRRTVRAGVRGTAAVGAAGAVALGATFVGRAPASVLPAARADAAPGTCGSDIGAVPQPADPPVGLMRTHDLSDGWALTSLGVPPAGGDLGRLMGRTATIQQFTALTALSAPELARETTSDDAAAARAELAQIEQEYVDAQAQVAAGAAHLDPEVVAGYPHVIARQRAIVERRDAARRAASSGGGADRPVQLLVTHGSTVVATGNPSREPNYSVSTALVGITPVELELVACSQPGAPGGEPLPAGEYGVYALYEADAGEQAAVGPWFVSLVEPPAPVTGLPADFPANEVALVGGRLVSATHLGRGADSGWGVEIAVDGDDAPLAAARLLGLESGVVATVTDGITIVPAITEGDIPGWHVRIAASENDEGEQTVVYTLTPLAR